MSPVPYALSRAVLFGLDPERAHELTLAMLARTQGTLLQGLYAQPAVDDPVVLAGLRFPNRVGLAAGLDKNARCIDALCAMGFGFVEVGTVTPRPQPGNPRPRMFRLPQAQALINRLGFNNEGLDAFLAHVTAARCRAPESRRAMLLGLNIGKNADTPIDAAIKDYLTCLDGVYAHADYVTVNISSPNTANLRSLQDQGTLDALLTELDGRREKLARATGRQVPVFLKIAPDLDGPQIDAIAATLRRHGLDGSGHPTQAWGVIATNTTIGRSTVQGLAHASEAGGLSGAPLLQPSNRVIAGLRQSLGRGFPIIGVGGIFSGADALQKIASGADVVQIYTGLIYRGPELVTEVARALAVATPAS